MCFRVLTIERYIQKTKLRVCYFLCHTHIHGITTRTKHGKKSLLMCILYEIKNPLSTIKINLKLISEELEKLEGSDSAESGKMAQEKSSQRLERALRKIAVIQKETDRLEQILDGFLRYVNRSELQLASVDINSLISDMVDFWYLQKM